MSKRPGRLELVKQVFASREHALARELAAFQSDLLQAERQLSQLKIYRDEHSTRLREQLTTDPGRLQNQQAFRQRLNEAITQQEQLVQRARIEGKELRQRWLAKRRKTQSVEKLSEQREQVELKHEASQEQKLQDEACRRSGKPSGLPSGRDEAGR